MNLLLSCSSCLPRFLFLWKLDLQDLTLAKLLLRPHPLFSDEATQEEVWVTKEKYGSVPRVYIVCDQDKIIKEAIQRWMIEKNPPDEVKVVPGSDHMLMFSKPQEMCSCLLEVAGKYSWYCQLPLACRNLLLCADDQRSSTKYQPADAQHNQRKVMRNINNARDN